MNSQTHKPLRDSNMELLRIIAMLLVVVVHANFRALPVPSVDECHTDVSSSILRFATESISIICVNLFVILSGWYGIKFKVSRLTEFLFQVLFFSVVCCALYYTLNPSGGSIVSDVANILLLKQSNYWFVKAYLGLYIFAPVLNAFVDRAAKREFRLFLVSFFVLQSLYGWLSPNAAPYFESGYSAISFIGLYMLGRYAKLYPERVWSLNKSLDMCIYAGIALFTTIAVFVAQRLGIDVVWRFYIYTSPLVIIAALHFLLFFSKIHFASRLINWIAASCFGVYLLHSNSYLAKPYYDNIILAWFEEAERGAFVARSAVFVATVFVAAILIDKLRAYLWERITTLFPKSN